MKYQTARHLGLILFTLIAPACAAPVGDQETEESSSVASPLMLQGQVDAWKGGTSTRTANIYDAVYANFDTSGIDKSVDVSGDEWPGFTGGVKWYWFQIELEVLNIWGKSMGRFVCGVSVGDNFPEGSCGHTFDLPPGQYRARSRSCFDMKDDGQGMRCTGYSTTGISHN